MKNIPSILTTVDPKQIRAKYGRIPCQDGELQSVAYTEIINEDFDPQTAKFIMQIGLDYPSRSTRTTISLTFPARQDGKMVGVAPQKHWMTQEDFEAMLRGELVKVPTYH